MPFFDKWSRVLFKMTNSNFIIPITQINNYYAPLSTTVFSLIVFATVLVAAGGYVVNDLLDVKIDLINKPDKVIVGKKLSLNTCWKLYWSLTTVAVLLGIYAAWLNGTNILMSLIAIEAGLLWLYSSILKKYFLVGNLVVAFLCSLAIIKPMLFNAPVVKVEGIAYLVMAYAAFAFMLTLIREIIKDMEDVKGDEAYDCKTMPVVIGIALSKIIVLILIVSVIGAIGWFQYYQTLSDSFMQTDYLSFSYISLFIQLPSLYLIGLLIKAKESKDFHRGSTVSKLIMAAGILSMVVFYLLF